MSEHPDIDNLDTDIRKLRLAYEKYFAGVERLEPMEDRDRIKRTLQRLRSEHSVNTARKFRLQQLQATLLTHESYWNRICRQIEEGTYKRHQLKAERLLAQRQAEAAEKRIDQEAEAEEPQTPSEPGRDAKSPAPVGTQTAAKRKAAGKPTYSDSLRRLHAAYVKAQQHGGATNTLSIAALANTIKKQTAVLKEKYKCQSVEFKVVLKGNKPVLKAIPK